MLPDLIPTIDPLLIIDGRKLVVTQQSLFAGVGDGFDLPLSPEAGSCSFALSPGQEGWTVSVTDPGPGLYVNGLPLKDEQASLSDGDHLEVGDHHDLVLVGGGQVRFGSQVIDLTGRDEVLIGRRGDCDLVLDGENVDARHARIRRTPSGLVVEDLRTKNGTRLNGHPVKTGNLTPGDRVGVGAYRIIFDGWRLIAPEMCTPLRVQARKATVKAGEVVLLDRVSVTLDPGTLTAIIGESGAGKSTLMGAISGHRPPDEGAVSLNGEPVNETRREIAVVPQSDLVHSALTVEETLLDSAGLRLPPDSSQAELQQAAARAMDELGLTERRDLIVSRLSGGERKRVSVGVELVSRPGVLLLDEPTTGLDPRLETETMALLKELAAANRTVALVTHATGSLSICDSLIVLGRGGVLCFQGPPAEALTFFEASDYADIYDALDKGTDRWAEAYGAITTPLGEGRALKASRLRRAPRFRDFARDFNILLRRQWRLLVRDRKNLLLVLGQAPVLAAVTAALFKDQVFEPDAPPGQTVQLLFVLVMISLWLGAIGSCREIVKEKSVVARERAAGVSAAPYLAAKLVFLTLLCWLQVAVLLGIVFAVQTPDIAFADWLLLGLVFGALSFAAVTMGLVISALAGTESQANSIVPLALIPQLLLGGAVIPPSQMTWVMEAVSRLAASQWGLRGAGAAIDLQTSFDSFPSSPATDGLATGFFDTGVWLAVAVLLTMGVIQLSATAMRLRTKA